MKIDFSKLPDDVKAQLLKMSEEEKEEWMNAAWASILQTYPEDMVELAREILSFLPPAFRTEDYVSRYLARVTTCAFALIQLGINLDAEQESQN